MRRRIAIWAGTVLGAMVLALLALFYTPPGLALTGRMAGALSGGTLRVEGLGGFFPNRLHAERVEIADAGGVWLRIDGAAIDWSALAMIGNHVSVEDVTAMRSRCCGGRCRRAKAAGKRRASILVD